MTSLESQISHGERPVSLATIAAIGLAGLGVLIALFALVGGRISQSGMRQGLVEARIAKSRIVLPAAAFANGRGPTEQADHLDLALAWPGMAPAQRLVPGPEGAPIEAPRSSYILVSLRPAQPGPNPAAHATVLYGRFLEPTVWSYPNDLLARRFRADSPYAGEELVFLPPEGQQFLARCPIDITAAEAESLCVMAIRRRDIDIVVAFHRALLSDAATLREQVLAFIDRAIR
jgi:hypothetical protein